MSMTTAISSTMPEVIAVVELIVLRNSMDTAYKPCTARRAVLSNWASAVNDVKKIVRW
jgi:hypothetical protein